MRVVPVVLVGLAGCAQLFGIADTSSPDAPVGTVSITFQRESIGASVSTSPLDLTGQTADFLIPDATDPSGYKRVPAMLTGNAFSAVIPTGNPLVEVTLPVYPTPYRHLYALPNRNILATFAVYEHPNPEPAPAGGTLDVNVGLPTPYDPLTEAFGLYAVGTFTTHQATGPELPMMAATTLAFKVPYDAAHFGSYVGRPLEKITESDLVLVLRYVGRDLTGYLEAPAFSQTGADKVMGTMLANPHNATLDVKLQPSKPGPRLAGVRPASATLSMNWGLYAAPGYARAAINGPQLNAGGVVPTDSGMLSVSYGNPFIAHAWKTVFHWNTYESRVYTDPASNLPVTLYAGLQQIVEPTTGLLLDLPSALPISVSVNQQALITDGTTINLDPARSVDLSATFDRATCTLYQMIVFELLPNNATPMPTALDRNARYVATTVDQAVKIPANAFTSGHLYTVRVYCILGGFPTLADGNLQNRMLPYSQGYLESGVFTANYVVGP